MKLNKKIDFEKYKVPTPIDAYDKMFAEVTMKEIASKVAKGFNLQQYLLDYLSVPASRYGFKNISFVINGDGYASVSLDHKVITLGEEFFNIKNLGEFLFRIEIIEHEFAHILDNKKYGHYDKEKNHSGRTTEGIYYPALKYIASQLPMELDKAMFSNVAEALYFLCPSEKMARDFGMEQYNQFINYLIESPDLSKRDKKALQDEIVFQKQKETKLMKEKLNIVKDFGEDAKKVYDFLVEQTVANEFSDPNLVKSLCSLQDMRTFASAKSYAKLMKFCEENDYIKGRFALYNSKYIPHDEKKFEKDKKILLTLPNQDKEIILQDLVSNFDPKIFETQSNISLIKTPKPIKAIPVENKKDNSIDWI